MEDQSKPNWIEITTLAFLILGGIFQYYFLDIYKRDETKTNIEINKTLSRIADIDYEFKRQKENLSLKSTEANLEFIKINSYLSKLEASIKSNYNKLKLSNEEVVLNLNKIELSVKQLKENLSIIEKKLNLSSNVQKILYSILPSMCVDYDIDMPFKYKNGTLEYSCNIINKGQYPLQLKQPTIIISRSEINDSDIFSEFETEYIGITGSIPPDTKIPVKIKIFNLQSLMGSFETIYIKTKFKFKQNNKIIKMMSKYSEHIISEKELEELSKSTFNISGSFTFN